MDDNKLSRALTWVGAGGSVLAVSALVTAGLYASAPDGASPASPMSSAATSRLDAASVKTSTTVKHDGRVTYPETRGINKQSPAPSTTTTTAPKPAAKAWTTSLPTQHLDAPIVGMTRVTGGSLMMVGSDGGVFSVGQAAFFGSLSGRPQSKRIVAAEADPVSGGYWLVGADGEVFGFNAGYFGSLSGHRLASPIVAMATTPDGNGYWLASADGGVYAFGDAPYLHAINGHHLSAPVVAIASTPTGKGYWLISEDGGVFTFGDAGYYGSLSGHRLATPVVAAASTPTGKGYWMVSQDGGVFAFGDAAYFGSASGSGAGPVSDIVPTATGKGYWLASRNGRVSAFGDAQPVAVTGTPGNVVTTAAATPAPHPAPAVAAEPAGRAAGRPINVIGRGAYTRGTQGIDLSQYQCGSIPATPTGVAVVQVTGGALDNAPNPCYVQEARWAGANMSAYIYMDGLPSPAPAASLNGPAGHCKVTNIACASYNYGYNYARNWVHYSEKRGIRPDTWWLDVERYSGWQDTISNQLVIHGALDGLKSMNVSTGIYSTSGQWQEITGNMAVPGEAEWTPGAGNLSGPGWTATSFCVQPGVFSFGGGKLKMVQYGYQGPFPGAYSGPATYDLDLSC